ncbi:MAG: glycosyltransferase [Actinobacteria bacterium]|nr:glycosyltransferase [Actinomycetota bacterium]
MSLKRVTWVAVSSRIDIWPQGSKPQAILQNPLPPKRLFPIQKGPQNIKRLVFIGRFSPEKRPDLALEIGAKTGIELEFIGDGAMRPSMEVEASKRNIKAHFRGRIHNPWLEIQSGDLLIVPSALEGDGLVVIEGLQQGTPMLLMDIPDFRRFDFPDKNYCADLSDFVSRVLEYSNNPKGLKVPVEAASAILHERELAVVGDCWEDFIYQLV